MGGEVAPKGEVLFRLGCPERETSAKSVTTLTTILPRCRGDKDQQRVIGGRDGNDCRWAAVQGRTWPPHQRAREEAARNPCGFGDRVLRCETPSARFRGVRDAQSTPVHRADAAGRSVTRTASAPHGQLRAADRRVPALSSLVLVNRDSGREYLLGFQSGWNWSIMFLGPGQPPIGWQAPLAWGCCVLGCSRK